MKAVSTRGSSPFKSKTDAKVEPENENANGADRNINKNAILPETDEGVPVTTKGTTTIFMLLRNALSLDLHSHKTQHARIQYKSGKFDLWTLGITIVIGGQYFSFNEGYANGYISYLICLLTMSLGYICLCMCLSEISSALPFAGGAYGLSRCTLGYTSGFLIGCNQVLEYIAYVSVAVVATAQSITDEFSLCHTLEPFLWLLIYATALYIHIYGGKVFWKTNLVIGLVSLGILLIYIIGAYAIADYKGTFFSSKNDDFYFVDGIPGFLHALPIASWFFVGVESLNFASDDVILPKRTIPASQVKCVLTLFVTAVLVYIITPTFFDNATLASVASQPLANGFSQMFGVSEKVSLIFTLPATYGTSFGFIYSFGRLIASMAKSKLFPFALSKLNSAGSPYLALLTGSILSFLVCFVVYYVPSFGKKVFNICFLNACISYMAQSIGYIILRMKFSNLIPTYRSPLGIFGAIIAFIVFFMNAIAMMFFQIDYTAIWAILVEMFLGLLYYYGYAKKRQIFSEEENKIMLVAHIMNFNARKKVANKGYNNAVNNKKKKPGSSGTKHSADTGKTSDKKSVSKNSSTLSKK